MSSGNKTWKILELLKTTEELFRNKGVNNPRLNAEMLLADTLKTERIKLYIDFEKPLNETELEDFRSKVKRRLNNEPLQYITGKAHFYGLEFCVNPSVLIPRPETELLVEKTLELVNQKGIAKPKILEIGTGSGCISISIAANAECIIDAIDISDEAVKTAASNANSNKLTGEINFIVKDFLNNAFNFDKYDIIISNPPYIPAGEMQMLEEQIRDFEPAGALTDNCDGLEFYRRIFGLYITSGHKPAVLLEIGDSKKEYVEQLLNDYKIMDYIFRKDLLNIFRVLEF